MHPDLVAIIEAINNRPARITLEKLAEDADVTVRWLQDFKARKIIQPTYTRVAGIRDALASYNRKD